MIKLPPIFSSNALYQQNSVLVFRGEAIAPVHAQIQLSDGTVFSSANTGALTDGTFSLTIATPPASLNACQIHLWEEHKKEEMLVLENILFGELWFASGQSNMELSNIAIDDYEEYLAQLSELPLRVYVQNAFCNDPSIPDQVSLPMPIEPTDSLSGTWKDMKGIAATGEASAVATAYIYRLYQHYLKNGVNIPIGFLNCTIGGTLIEGWLPYKDLDEDDETAVGLIRRPDPETWNTFGMQNYQQPTALYNLKVYPLRGLKVKGVIWYQGESNLGRPGSTDRYKRYLDRYYKTYQEMFAADESFHMVMSLLFPFSYRESGECLLTGVNKAMVEMARDYRDRFTAVPIYDFSPIWGYEPFYHPIHPTNKYPVGERMADCYVNQLTAPTLREVQKNGKRLLLTFDNLNGSLKIDGKRLYGLYIRGEKTEYLEAEGECINDTTLSVWHPYIEAPCHVAYQASSMACDGNLWGGVLPVAPFSTEEAFTLHIEGKPWLHTEKPAAWICDCPFDTPEGGYFNYFTHAIWQPALESEVCSDPVFYKNIASLRIYGESNRFGTYTKSRYYNRLDLQNYSALEFYLFNARAVSEGEGYVQAEITFVPENKNPYILTRKAERISEIKRGWAKFRITFGELPADFIERLTLTFNVGQCVYHFVNVDGLVLVPREKQCD